MLLGIQFFTISFSVVFTYHAEHTRNFLAKENNVTKERFENFNESNDTINLDGFKHYKISELSSNDKIKVQVAEKDFRKLVLMKAYKYIYKRDLAWRTWRKVKMDDGTEKVVFYKCNNNQLQRNLTACSYCGPWTIEDSPPCPLEYLYMIDKDWMCVHNISLHPENLEDSCPAKIKFHDLPPSCDNPMETTWRFTTDFKEYRRRKNVICQGKIYCEIFSTYLISPQNVTFRLVNSENNIIYSRIMLPNNVNYVCMNHCGHYDPQTKNVTKVDSPMKLNLTSSQTNESNLVMTRKPPKMSMPGKNLKIKIYQIFVKRKKRPVIVRAQKKAAKQRQRYTTFSTITTRMITEPSRRNRKHQDDYFEEYGNGDLIL